MRPWHSLAFAVLIATLCIDPVPLGASCGSYDKYRLVYIDRPGGFQDACWPDVPCTQLITVWADTFSCATDAKLSSHQVTISRFCACRPFTLYANDAIVPSAYHCDDLVCKTASTEPELCDGKEPDSAAPFDKACGNDEHSCKSSDQDGAPIRFSSGRVETNPITLFSLPTPDQIFFGFQINWGSHLMRTRAQAQVVNGVQDTVPTIHTSDEVTHYFGDGWIDNYSDRLYINVHDKTGTTITWSSHVGPVTFTAATGWKSWSGKFELIDRGPNPPDGFGRWVVRTTDTNAPRAIWAFDEFTYTDYSNATLFTLGRLRRRALLTSDLSNLNGRYGFTIDWAADGTLIRAVDSLGRALDFVYQTVVVGTITSVKTLARVQYRPASGTAVDVVLLTMAGDYQKLDRVERVGIGGYTRFLYWQSGDVDCTHCGSLLTDVVVPGDGPPSTPANQAAILPREVVLEHHDYGPAYYGGLFRYGAPFVGIHSKYPGREYAYEQSLLGDDSYTAQFDLHQVQTTNGGLCDQLGACDAGYGCRSADSHCYVADTIRHDPSTRHMTARGAASGDSNGSTSFGSRSFSPSGAPRTAVDAAGIKTTYGHDSQGRIRCLVDPDDDDEAFTDPAHPDTSSCAGPIGAKIVRIDYGTATVTKTTSGVLGATIIETSHLDSTSQLPTSVDVVASTKDITGAIHSETHTDNFQYDTLGRVTSSSGPVINAVATEETTTSYYDVPGGTWPYNFGHVHQVTRHVRTTTSDTLLITTYAEYDIFGVPHRVTEPNGNQVTYSPSTDRLTWTITQVGSDGFTVGASTVTLNANGTVRSVQDPDGVCLTYEYADATGFVGVPTVIRRSNTACGALPINQNNGEVEIRTYVNGERDRLQSVTRKNNGATEFSYSGFTYDRDRRVIAATTLDSAEPFTFAYTDVLPSGVTAPGAPAAGSWKTETTADVFGRPASLSRFLDTTNKQTYTYSYTSSLSPRPTTLMRGYNGSSTSVTTFVYDDFGRLIETTVPEAGAPGTPRPTRYEYDIAGRLVKKRVGVGSTAVRTSQYTYDSLSRLTSVDNDTEHPVDCGTAPAGMPIQDEEYKYDSCPEPDVPTGVTCTNALGRLAISRVILQCGTAHDIVKRGRWYSYDKVGRLSQIAYATVTGSIIGTPATMPYTYSAGSRMTSYASPLNSKAGLTTYTIDSASARISAVTTYQSVPIASNIAYQAFGGITALDTASIQPITGGTRMLKFAASYRQDGTLSNVSWTQVNSGAGVDISILSQAMSYGPAGLLSNRIDLADFLSSRYYGYDALSRMTCEARGDTHTQPSSGDCVITSPRLAGLFTFADGQTSTSPPDVRLTSYSKDAGTSGSSYTSPSVETSTYASGSGQVQQLSRTGSNIVIGYDAVGRRSFEYDSSEPTRSRRDYTYLPNGQLGSVQGQTSTNAPYSVAMRYDAEGRPLSISYSSGDSYELFWDDASRLITVSITGSANIRWHYHYLDTTLVAATRELVAEQTVKRFWPVTDERGLIYRMLDEVGATYWQARWDASGWRSLVGTPQPNMWVPFALAGQIILEGTEAYSGTSGTATRPAIALNRWRAYDPLVSAFIQADESDQLDRQMPEGYSYGRNNAVKLIDPTGHNATDAGQKDSSDPYAELQRRLGLLGGSYFLETNCKEFQQKVRAAIAYAYFAISTCTGKGCKVHELLERKWIASLLYGLYTCPPPGLVKTTAESYIVLAPQMVIGSANAHKASEFFSMDLSGEYPAFSGNGPEGLWKIFMSPAILSKYEPLPCLAYYIAHEAAHGAMNDQGSSYPREEQFLHEEIPKCFRGCASAY